MKVYIICPVRNADPFRTEFVQNYVDRLRADGHEVHFPVTDVEQDDPTGEAICKAHSAAMIEAALSGGRCDIFWDTSSKGSHFDAGMAYILNRLTGFEVRVVTAYQPDTAGKSYEKVLRSMTREEIA